MTLEDLITIPVNESGASITSVLWVEVNDISDNGVHLTITPLGYSKPKLDFLVKGNKLYTPDECTAPAGHVMD